MAPSDSNFTTTHHHFLTHATHPDSVSSSSTSSPPSSTCSPRSSRDEPLSAPPPTRGLDLFDDSLRPSSDEHERSDTFSSTNSDSYDSAGESTMLHHQHQLSGDSAVQYARWTNLGNDEGGYCSSRANSPIPHAEHWEGYRSEPLSYRSLSRNRSRNPSGTTTPVMGHLDKEIGGSDYHSHHYQTSALLRKLGGTLAPDNSPVLGHKKRRPGWWARRAETRHKGISSIDSSAFSPRQTGSLLGSPSTASRSSRNRSCLSTFGAALLRQPWVPTQPLTILFSFLLFGCFAATLTTFLVHVLSSDRQPLPWRRFCQEQRPFPHELADSLNPVSVFVGVFSVAQAVDRRNAIRLTYAKHSKPIDPTTGRPTTDIQVKFVLGRPPKKWSKRIALEMEMFNDIVMLDIPENMNRGKTFKYFSWAAENATVPVYFRQDSASSQVSVGFKKTDYVVKADDDAFIHLGELERHLRVTPREKTYWGYLVRNFFMAGEAYALSRDLVDYVATYAPIRQHMIGKEDQRTAYWLRKLHPAASSIHWVTERCQIYDHPKAGTTYSHGFLYPSGVESVKAELRHGISEEERIRRGGELADAYSTVSTWKKEYVVPADGLSIEEQVEALVEGGGRWATTNWRSDNGRGPEAVRWDAVRFETDDERIKTAVELNTSPPKDATGVVPGVPDRSATIPSARTTRFGKDLYRDPEGVEAVQKVKGKRSLSEEQLGPEVEVYNSVHINEDGTIVASSEVETSSSSASSSSSTDSAASSSDSTESTDSTISSSSNDESSTLFSSSSSLEADSSLLSSASSSPAPFSPPENLPTAQIRLPGQNYILPPSSADRLVPPPTHRYDSATLALRDERYLGLAHGGTVVVHYLKYNEWFYETALALLGREKMWDGGVEATPSPVLPFADAELARLPSWTGKGQVELVDARWGGARMYGSPIVREDGFISEGRPAESRREVVVPNVPTNGGRWSRNSRMPLLGLRLEDGVEASVGGDVNAAQEESEEQDSLVGLVMQP